MEESSAKTPALIYLLFFGTTAVKDGDDHGKSWRSNAFDKLSTNNNLSREQMLTLPL